ncbi:MAG: hypothetical protein JWP09_551 [Candidatus Taylorbacteria bacterium]|nr:hypothetical protein [Candidatus Taylorbacteria bacterium]
MIGNKIGKLGEDLAEKYLINKGFKVLYRNYWKPYGEIDIICEKAGKTHFVEVKSVSVSLNNVSHENIRPEDNVHEAKLRKLARVIQVYISAFHVKSWQFDVVIVYIDQVSKKAEVKVLENQILEARN